jgi:hypothetical protein
MFNRYQRQQYTMDSLAAYERGPVYLDIYKEWKSTYGFKNIPVSESPYMPSYVYQKEEEISLRKALFLIRSLTEKELSDLTHKLDMWKSKRDYIYRGHASAIIREKDITPEDDQRIALLFSICSDDPNMVFINYGEKRFALTKIDAHLLTQEHHDVLRQLSMDEDLYNPVYITLEEGALIID